MSPRQLKLALIFAVALSPFALAQDPLASPQNVITKPYDGIQAGLDAYRLAEEKRQGAVNQQLSLNDQLRYWNGYATSRGETIYYGYTSPAALATYGYSGYGPWTGFQLGPWMGGGTLGGIWGTPAYYQPARQPIGQQQIQIGPNHWESHPVYDPPLTMYRPQPPVDSPLLDRTPYATTMPTTISPTTTTPTTPVPTVTPPGPTPKLIDSIGPPPGPPASTPTPARGPREY